MQFDKGFLQNGGAAFFLETNEFERLPQLEEYEELANIQNGGKSFSDEKDNLGSNKALYGGVSVSELLKNYQERMQENRIDIMGGGVGGISSLKGIHERFKNLAVPFSIFYDNRHERIQENAMQINGYKPATVMPENMFNKMFYSVGVAK
jgi:predicted CopG family antitoxin